MANQSSKKSLVLKLGKADQWVWWVLVGPLSLATLAILVVGLVSSGFDTSWWIICWLIGSMSIVHWALNRILHGVFGVAGETERDGVVWLVPLALGFFLGIAFLISGDIMIRLVIILIWTVITTGVVQIIRPEISGWKPQPNNQWEPTYREARGLWHPFLSLFKYRLDVDAAGCPDEDTQWKPRGSLSTGIYYMAFALTAMGILYVASALKSSGLSGSANALVIGFLVGYVVLIITFLGICAGGLYFTFKMPAKEEAWPIAAGERWVLAVVFFADTCSLIIASVFWLALPLLRFLGMP